MYRDKQRRSAYCDNGDGDKDKYVPYSVPRQPYRIYQSSVVSSSLFNRSSPSPPEASFYASARETDVGICFSMSNVDLNSDYPPPYLGRASLSGFGEGYSDASSIPALPAFSHPQPKYRPAPSSAGRISDPAPPTGCSQQLSTKALPSQQAYYFAHPKIPVQIYNNRTYPYHPAPPSSTSSASAAAAYGQQLNNYYDAYRPPQVATDQRRGAYRTLFNNQYDDICLGSWKTPKQEL